MPYATTAQVAGLCQNLLGGASDFSASSSPTSTMVGVWLSAGSAIVNATLSGIGYTVPAASTTDIYAFLTELNSLFAAARAELSRTNVTLALGERTRGQVMDKMFWDELERLKKMPLDGMGLDRGSIPVYVGGISQSDKDSVVDNSDRVSPRFFRGQFGFKGTSQPQLEEALEDD